jgi:coiled-coil domain-containing protein 63/114
MRESSGLMGMGVGDFNSSLNTKENFPSGLRNIVANRADVRSMERVQNFEEAFDKIVAATGITDIEGLVRTFIQNEDHNFSLFNYVNEQNNEIEKLQEQIQLLGAEEKEFAVESGDDFHQHKQALKELESKLLTNDLMAEKYDVRCQDLQRTVENLKRGIQSIHEKFSIDGGERKINIGLAEMVVTESNMAQHLAAIEQKANVILQMYAEQLQHVAIASTHASATGFAFKASTESGLKASIAKDEPLTATVLSSGPTSSQPRRPSAASVGYAVASSVLGAGPKVPMGQDALHVSCRMLL